MRYSISPREIHKLLNSDWQTPNGAIYVHDDLSLAEAQQSRFFRNVRILHTALKEIGGTKATAAGNLNRKFVAEMLERIDLPPDHAEIIRSVKKVINEQDVWDLHITRVILELGGLIRRHSGMFKVIEKRSHLMEDEHAGTLYQLLFLTFFRQFNLAYLDWMNEAPLVQSTIPVSLLIVSRLTEDWASVEEMAACLFPERVREQIIEGAYSDNTPYIAHSRIIRPLVNFGLLEEREQEDRWTERQVRKTDLFDRLLQFNVDVSSASAYLH